MILEKEWDVFDPENYKEFKPYGGWCIVRRLKPSTETPGGMLLPENSLPDENRAIVVAVGPGFMNNKGDRVPLEYEVGDKVILGGGAKFVLEYRGSGTQLLLCRNESIICGIVDVPTLDLD